MPRYQSRGKIPLRTVKYVPNNAVLERRIKKLQDKPEVKYHDQVDTILGQQIKQDSSVVFQLNKPGAFSVENKLGFDGLSFHNTSMRIGMQFSFDPNAYLSNYTCRVLIFWDKSPDPDTRLYRATSEDPEVLPDPKSVLDNSVIKDPLFMPYNVKVMGTRFKILYDKIVTLSATANYVPVADPPAPITYMYGAAVTRVIRKKFKLSRVTDVGFNGFEIEYLSNGLYLGICSNESGIPDIDPPPDPPIPDPYAIDFFSRVYFVDP